MLKRHNRKLEANKNNEAAAKRAEEERSAAQEAERLSKEAFEKLKESSEKIASSALSIKPAPIDPKGLMSTGILEQISESNKKLWLCIKCFQGVEQSLNEEQEKLPNSLDASENKCSEIGTIVSKKRKAFSPIEISNELDEKKEVTKNISDVPNGTKKPSRSSRRKMLKRHNRKLEANKNNEAAAKRAEEERRAAQEAERLAKEASENLKENSEKVASSALSIKPAPIDPKGLKSIGKLEQISESNKKLRLCIKWCQGVEQILNEEQEKLTNLLDASEKKCSEIEMGSKSKMDGLNAIIGELRHNYATLQDKYKEESEKSDAIECQTREKEARIAAEASNASLSQELEITRQEKAAADQLVVSVNDMHKRLQEYNTSLQQLHTDLDTANATLKRLEKEKSTIVDNMARLRGHFTSTLQNSSPSPSVLVGWSPPPHNTTKLNFDGSVKGNSAAAGAILRNSKGECLKACSYNLGCTPVIIAEITGLRNGILMALEDRVDNIIIEGDNLAIINAILDKWNSPSVIHHLVQGIKLLLQCFKAWKLQHIYREANQATDWIATVGHLISDKMYISQGNNSRFQEILRLDRLGATFVRKGS